MSQEEEDIVLAELPDDELVEQMFDDLYDGLADEIAEGTQILLDRGWAAKKVLDEALVGGMVIVGEDFRDGILFVPAASAAEPVEHPWLQGEGPPVFLGVGKFKAQKGFDVLIRAFAKVRAQRPAPRVQAWPGAPAGPQSKRPIRRGSMRSAR